MKTVLITLNSLKIKRGCVRGRDDVSEDNQLLKVFKKEVDRVCKSCSKV